MNIALVIPVLCRKIEKAFYISKHFPFVVFGTLDRQVMPEVEARGLMNIPVYIWESG